MGLGCPWRVQARMLAIVLLLMYLVAATWLAASTRAAAGHSAGHSRRAAGLGCAAAAWLMHGYDLCEQVFRTGNWALSTSAAASLIGWVMALLVGILVWRKPRFALIGAVLLACVGGFAAITGLTQAHYTELTDHWTLIAHIVLSVLAYSLISVAAVMAAALLLLDRRLRSHQPLGWLAHLPSVEALETGMFSSLRLGFGLLTLALFSGLIFVDNLLAQHLVHKTVLSLLTWLSLAILLLGRQRLGWRGRVAARWALGCAGLLALAYFGSKFVLENVLGRHWT